MISNTQNGQNIYLGNPLNMKGRWLKVFFQLAWDSDISFSFFCLSHHHRGRRYHPIDDILQNIPAKKNNDHVIFSIFRQGCMLQSNCYLMGPSIRGMMKPLMVSAMAPTSLPKIQSKGPRPVNLKVRNSKVKKENKRRRSNKSKTAKQQKQRNE